ncbi:MAG TPA: fatty acid desaturase [Xanthomonadales bacterium]|nr:fatty acid desaturase [Xanthomonadales bacterium]
MNNSPQSKTECAGNKPVASIATWKAAVAPFQRPNRWRASWQLINSICGFAIAWALMYFTVQISWWLTIPLIIITGGLQIRIFIFFHDCGHGSFFRSRKANSFWGFICGILTFTPYYRWRWEHNRHHARSGNLNHRGTGDIWTMTVQEYLDAPRITRLRYRIARNPFMMFLIGPLYLYLFKERFVNSAGTSRETWSVIWMNLALIPLFVGMILLFGWVNYLIIQLAVLLVAGSVGIWLFYVQHQFEDVYWGDDSDWNYTEAALKGSSYYNLPRILHWFTGNIGFHHIHHLSPKVPNYNLQRCHESSPVFSEIKGLTLLTSMKSMSLRLFDESTRKMVGYGHLRTLGAEAGKP